MFKFTPEWAYVLGFLWGDGHFSNSVSVEIVKHDLADIKPIFESVSDWIYSERNRPNRQPQASLRTQNPQLRGFLKNHGYVSYRIISPDKIIEAIPREFQKFWHLGFFDADGGWYINEKLSLFQCVWTSKLIQDWTFIENLLNGLEIKYKIERKQLVKSAYSQIRIQGGREAIAKFGNWLYAENKIGLQRKKMKFLSMAQQSKAIRGPQ